MPDKQVKLRWLGQAGFLLQWKKISLAIDPYLSDTLRKKYQGTSKPHERLFPPPFDPAKLTGIRAVLCTHRHTDHMDPGTIPQLLEANPGARVVVPRAEIEHAAGLPIPRERIDGANAGERIDLGDDIAIDPVPAAHERMETDKEGNHLFLGYIVRLGDTAIYHSGDSVPWDGQDDLLTGAGIRVALLPVNGRDDRRRSLGIAGNYTFEEAVELCRNAGIPFLVPHHHGLFANNTATKEELEAGLARCKKAHVRCWLPRIDQCLKLTSR